MTHNRTALHNGHNDSIGCSVTECKYHDKNEHYCTLEQIQVVKHGSGADSAECTDCASFERM